MRETDVHGDREKSASSRSPHRRERVHGHASPRPGRAVRRRSLPHWHRRSRARYDARRRRAKAALAVKPGYASRRVVSLRPAPPATNPTAAACAGTARSRRSRAVAARAGQAGGGSPAQRAGSGHPHAGALQDRKHRGFPGYRRRHRLRGVAGADHADRHRRRQVARKAEGGSGAALLGCHGATARAMRRAKCHGSAGQHAGYPRQLPLMRPMAVDPT